jgi:hypothetical protein
LKGTSPTIESVRPKPNVRSINEPAATKGH